MATPQPSASAAPEQPALEFDGYVFDPAGQVLSDAQGRDVPLTRAEWQLLDAFLRHPGRVLTREHLRLAIAGRGVEAYERSVDMLVARLRRKIEPQPKQPRLILTVPGFGYKFRPRPRPAGAPAPALEQPVPLRRQLTVLRGQVMGLAAAAAHLDPEELCVAIAAVHEVTGEATARHGGHLVWFHGDSRLACFGHPEVGADDPVRAVRAAIELAATMAERRFGAAGRLPMRVGIASGLAVIGAF